MEINHIQSRFQPFRKNDTDFTTDIQTLDELTSCTDMSDIDSKKRRKGLSATPKPPRVKPNLNHN